MKSTPKLDNLSICIHVALKLQIWAHWPRHHAKNQISALTFLNNKSLKKTNKTKQHKNQQNNRWLSLLYLLYACTFKNNVDEYKALENSHTIYGWL